MDLDIETGAFDRNHSILGAMVFEEKVLRLYDGSSRKWNDKHVRANTITKSSDNDIVYYFKENKLTFVKSGNLYQIENNQAFAFNERNKFVCGGRYEIYPTLNKSIFIEEGGITQYEFYSDDSFKRGVLLSLNSYSFLISEYGKKRASGLKTKLFNMDYFHLRKQLKY